MSLYFPEGPISNGDTVMLGYWSGVDLYILVDSSGDVDSTQDYIYENAIVDNPTIASLSQTVMSRAAQFKVQGTTDSLSFEEIQPKSGSYLGWKIIAGVVTPVKSSTTVNLIPSQFSYQPWNPPTVLLAGVKYDLNVDITGDGTYSPIVMPVSGNPTVTSVTSNIMIPLTYYYDCGSGSCYESNYATNATLVSYCSLRGTIGVEKCTSVAGPAWTTVDDATTAHVYSYCPAGKYCQTNCKAPCPNDNQECTYNGTTFICKTTLDSIFSGSWWTDTWFILLVGGIVLIVLIVVISIAYVKSKRKKETSITQAFPGSESDILASGKITERQTLNTTYGIEGYRNPADIITHYEHSKIEY